LEVKKKDLPEYQKVIPRQSRALKASSFPSNAIMFLARVHDSIEYPTDTVKCDCGPCRIRWKAEEERAKKKAERKKTKKAAKKLTGTS
jgi:hypothetical protein